MYLYAGGDPVNFIDPTGREPTWSGEEVDELLRAYAKALKKSKSPHTLMLQVHKGCGIFDFHCTQTFDTFEVTNVGVLNAAQFGNFIAGFASGYLKDDGSAYVLVRLAGMFYGLPGSILENDYDWSQLYLLGDDQDGVDQINYGYSYGRGMAEFERQGWHSVDTAGQCPAH